MGKFLYRVSEGFFLFLGTFITALPSGELLGFPVKTIFAALLLIIFIIYAVKFNIKISQNTILSILLFAEFLTFYLFIGYINFGYTSIKEFKLMFVTFYLSIIIYWFISLAFSLNTLVKMFRLSILVLFCIKFIAYYKVLKYHDAQLLLNFFKTYFSTNVITMKLPFNLYRVYLPTDIIAAFYPFIISWFFKKKMAVLNKKEFLLLFLCAFIVFSGFSRYLIVVFLTGLALMLYYSNLNKKYIGAFAAIMLFISTIFSKALLSFLKLRFLSKATKASDMVRLQQTAVILDLFKKSPLLGSGIGAFSYRCIRSLTNPFSYEEQILSFFPKFGVLGMAIFFTLIIYVFTKFLKRRELFSILYLALFLFSGWFNPYLYSSTVVLLYVFIFVLLNSENKFERRNHAV